MSNDQPTPGQPPEDDPFLKKPQVPPTPPSASGSESGSGTGSGSESGPGSGPGSGSPYDGAQPPPPPPPPYDPHAYGGGPYGGTDPLAGMPPLAEPGKRILARLIDFLIISIPLYLISLPFGGAVEMSDNGNGDSASDVFTQTYNGHQLLWSLIALVVYVAYDTYFTHKDGRTIGKRLLKLRVAMLNDGRVPDTSASFLRAVVLWLPALLCCPCLWWLINIVLMFTDKPYRQGLHDKAAKTVVVSAA
ncbi:RDD family protein [Streptomyces sp. NPDC005181]|uniref:RDD family protein n=1 Tax=Streptomyces sp. NPDC005181 TaxID=3156869 RepID=UPI0033B666CA